MRCHINSRFIKLISTVLCFLLFWQGTVSASPESFSRYTLQPYTLFTKPEKEDAFFIAATGYVGFYLLGIERENAFSGDVAAIGKKLNLILDDIHSALDIPEGYKNKFPDEIRYNGDATAVALDLGTFVIRYFNPNIERIRGPVINDPGPGYKVVSGKMISKYLARQILRREEIPAGTEDTAPAARPRRSAAPDTGSAFQGDPGTNEAVDPGQMVFAFHDYQPDESFQSKDTGKPALTPKERAYIVSIFLLKAAAAAAILWAGVSVLDMPALDPFTSIKISDQLTLRLMDYLKPAVVIVFLEGFLFKLVFPGIDSRINKIKYFIRSKITGLKDRPVFAYLMRNGKGLGVKVRHLLQKWERYEDFPREVRTYSALYMVLSGPSRVFVWPVRYGIGVFAAGAAAAILGDVNILYYSFIASALASNMIRAGIVQYFSYKNPDIRFGVFKFFVWVPFPIPDWFVLSMQLSGNYLLGKLRDTGKAMLFRAKQNHFKTVSGQTDEERRLNIRDKSIIYIIGLWHRVFTNTYSVRDIERELSRNGWVIPVDERKIVLNEWKNIVRSYSPYLFHVKQHVLRVTLLGINLYSRSRQKNDMGGGFPDELRDLVTASLAHDLGKDHRVVMRLELQPRVITEEERNWIRREHVLKWREVVESKGLRFNGRVERAVMAHHPENVSTGDGGDLALIDQVLCVSDQIDARSDMNRPYRNKTLEEWDINVHLSKLIWALNNYVENGWIGEELFWEVCYMIMQKDRRLFDTIFSTYYHRPLSRQRLALERKIKHELDIARIYELSGLLESHVARFRNTLKRNPYHSVGFDQSAFHPLIRRIEHMERIMGVKRFSDYFEIEYNGARYQIHPYKEGIGSDKPVYNVTDGIEALSGDVEEALKGKGNGPLIIQVNGRSGSGKTYLTGQLKFLGMAGISSEEIATIHTDDYLIERNGQRKINMAQLLTDYERRPAYTRLVIVEGVNSSEVFGEGKLCQQPDVRVFIKNTDERLLWTRILKRNIEGKNWAGPEYLMERALVRNIDFRYGLDREELSADVVIDTASVTDDDITRGGNDTFGPALFVDPVTSEVRELRDTPDTPEHLSEHDALNRAVEEIVFGQNGSGPLQKSDALSDFVNSNAVNMPVNVYVVDRDRLREYLTLCGYPGLADGLITHAGTWRDPATGRPRANNLFIPSNIYNALSGIAELVDHSGKNRPDRFIDQHLSDTLSLWREHEIAHLVDREKRPDRKTLSGTMTVARLILAISRAEEKFDEAMSERSSRDKTVGLKEADALAEKAYEIDNRLAYVFLMKGKYYESMGEYRSAHDYYMTALCMIGEQGKFACLNHPITRMILDVEGHMNPGGRPGLYNGVSAAMGVTEKQSVSGTRQEKTFNYYALFPYFCEYVGQFANDGSGKKAHRDFAKYVKPILDRLLRLADEKRILHPDSGSPNNEVTAYIYYLAGENAYRNGDYNGAYEYYSKGLNSFGGYPYLYSGLAVSMIMREDVPSGDILETAALLVEQGFDACGDHDTLPETSEFIESHKRAVSVCGRARERMEEGKYGEAEEILAELDAESRPVDQPGYVAGLRRELHSRVKEKKARERSLAKKRQRGKELMESGQYDEAESNLRSVLEADPHDGEAAGWLASIPALRAEEARERQAARRVEDVLQEAHTFLMTASNQKAAGKIAKARKNYVKALGILRVSGLSDEKITGSISGIENTLAEIEDLPDRMDPRENEDEGDSRDDLTTETRPAVAEDEKEASHEEQPPSAGEPEIVFEAYLLPVAYAALNNHSRLTPDDRSRVLAALEDITREKLGHDTHSLGGRGKILRMRLGNYLRIIFTRVNDKGYMILAIEKKKKTTYKRILKKYDDDFDFTGLLPDCIKLSEVRDQLHNGQNGHTFKAPGSLGLDEDKNVDHDYIEGLVSDATERTVEVNIPEAVEYIREHAPPAGGAVIDPSIIRVYTVNGLRGRYGIPRYEGAVDKARDMIYAYVPRPGPDGCLNIYVTDKFYREHLKSDMPALAELIDHEFTENILGLSHRFAASRARLFVPDGGFLSPFHYFYINRVVSEKDYSLISALSPGRDVPDDVKSLPGTTKPVISRILAYERLFFRYLRFSAYLMKSRDSEDPEVLAECSLRAYKIMANTPGIRLTKEEQALYERVKDKWLHIDEFESTRKTKADLAHFAISELDGENVIYAGNRFDKHGVLKDKTGRALLTIKKYADRKVAFSMAHGDLFRLWVIGDKETIMDFKQMGQIFYPNGMFRKRFYFKIPGAQFDGLDACLIREHRLDSAGILNIGGRHVDFGEQFANARVEINVRSGQIDSVKILDESGETVQDSEFVLIYKDKRLVGSFFKKISLHELAGYGKVVLRRFTLDESGRLYLGTTGENGTATVPCFSNHPGAVTEIHVENGEIKAVDIPEDPDRTVRYVFNKGAKLAWGVLDRAGSAEIPSSTLGSILGTAREARRLKLGKGTGKAELKKALKALSLYSEEMISSRFRETAVCLLPEENRLLAEIIDRQLDEALHGFTGMDRVEGYRQLNTLLRPLGSVRAREIYEDECMGPHGRSLTVTGEGGAGYRSLEYLHVTLQTIITSLISLYLSGEEMDDGRETMDMMRMVLEDVLRPDDISEKMWIAAERFQVAVSELGRRKEYKRPLKIRQATLERIKEAVSRGERLGLAQGLHSANGLRGCFQTLELMMQSVMAKGADTDHLENVEAELLGILAQSLLRSACDSAKRSGSRRFDKTAVHDLTDPLHAAKIRNYYNERFAVYYDYSLRQARPGEDFPFSHIENYLQLMVHSIMTYIHCKYYEAERYGRAEAVAGDVAAALEKSMEKRKMHKLVDFWIKKLEESISDLENREQELPGTAAEQKGSPGTIRAPASLPLDEDERTDIEYIRNEIIPGAVERTSEIDIQGAIRYIKENTPPVAGSETLEELDIRLFSVDIRSGSRPLLGIPRFRGAARPQDLIYVYSEFDKETGTLDLYCSDIFYEHRILYASVESFAEQLDHEFVETVLGLSHRIASSRARYFIPESGFLSPFHHFFIDRIIAESQYEWIECLKEERPVPEDIRSFYMHDEAVTSDIEKYGKRFYEYATHLLNITGTVVNGKSPGDLPARKGGFYELYGVKPDWKWKNHVGSFKGLNMVSRVAIRLLENERGYPYRENLETSFTTLEALSESMVRYSDCDYSLGELERRIAVEIVRTHVCEAMERATGLLRSLEKGESVTYEQIEEITEPMSMTNAWKYYSILQENYEELVGKYGANPSPDEDEEIMRLYNSISLLLHTVLSAVQAEYLSYHKDNNAALMLSNVVKMLSGMASETSFSGIIDFSNRYFQGSINRFSRKRWTGDNIINNALNAAPLLAQAFINLSAAKKDEEPGYLLLIDDSFGASAVEEVKDMIDLILMRLENIKGNNRELKKCLKGLEIRVDSPERLRGKTGRIPPENMIVITREVNRSGFLDLEGRSLIISVEDSRLRDTDYVAVSEITLFAVSKFLGYSENILLERYGWIPNAKPFDELTGEEIKALFFGKTFNLELIPPATPFDVQEMVDIMTRVNDILSKA